VSPETIIATMRTVLQKYTEELADGSKPDAACTEIFISRRHGAVGGFISATLHNAKPESIPMIRDTVAEYDRLEAERIKRQRRLT
jgi:hypothetical protein